VNFGEMGFALHSGEFLGEDKLNFGIRKVKFFARFNMRIYKVVQI